MPRTALPYQRHVSMANRLTKQIETAERKRQAEIGTLERRRRKSWLAANRSGATYEHLVEACSVSDGYLGKQMRIARRENPRLAERPSSVPENRWSRV